MLADLKVLAKDAFAVSWFVDRGEGGDHDDLPYIYIDYQIKTVIVIYESTPESDRSLRDMVLLSQQIAINERSLLADQTFRSLLATLPALALDLLSKPLLPGRYRCIQCGVKRYFLGGSCRCSNGLRCAKSECMSDRIAQAYCHGCFVTGSLQLASSGGD